MTKHWARRRRYTNKWDRQVNKITIRYVRECTPQFWEDTQRFLLVGGITKSGEGSILCGNTIDGGTCVS